jgi:predicted DNA-binding transcriptional regulator AlpA
MAFGDAQNNPVVRLKDAARYAGVCTKTLRKMCAAGTGPRLLRISTNCLGIRRHDLEAWLAERKQVR